MGSPFHELPVPCLIRPMQTTVSIPATERSIGAEVFLRESQKAHVSRGNAPNLGAIPLFYSWIALVGRFGGLSAIANISLQSVGLKLGLCSKQSLLR